MWKVMLLICTIGSPCVTMVENPMQYYQDYDQCMIVAEEKHNKIVETFSDYGYYIENSEFKCEADGS